MPDDLVSPWLRRVRLTNYKSIAFCDVSLGPLTVLVGPNGSGKSNFVDALAFVRDAVSVTPYHAIEARGGLGEILRRVPTPMRSFRIELDLAVLLGGVPRPQAECYYGFEIERGSRPGQRPVEVVWEACDLRWRDRQTGRDQRIDFRVERGVVEDSSFLQQGLVSPDRLYLPLVGVRSDARFVVDQLSRMRFHHFRYDVLRQTRPQSAGAVLGEAGEHIGDVLGELAESSPETKQRIDAYLASVAPNLTSIDRRFAGEYTTIEARQSTGPDGSPVVFGPDAVSDGTIRAIGLLTALFQPAVARGQVSLVGMEEPETALHPAAAGVLFDALTEASERVQVLVTTQSDDLLDRDDVDPSVVRAVRSNAGLTEINTVDAAIWRAVGQRKFTLGELMRAGQLSPAQTGGPDTSSGSAA